MQQLRSDYLGVMVPADVIIKKAIEEQPDLFV
jgi:hypothetical protein